MSIDTEDALARLVDRQREKIKELTDQRDELLAAAIDAYYLMHHKAADFGGVEEESGIDTYGVIAALNIAIGKAKGINGPPL